MRRLLPAVTLLLSATIWSCAAPATAPENEDDLRDGVYLYRKHCSKCHGVLTMTSKPGRRPARIKSAIKQNVGGMGFLSTLPDEDISMIADALLMVDPPDDATGDELYETFCSDCHRPADNSDIAGKSFSDIKTALDDVMCNTVSLEFLSDNDMKKLSAFLESAGTGAEQTGEPAAVREAAGFEVARFLTCEGVADREPVGVASDFPAEVEKVYAFIEAKDVKRNLNVYFVWYLDGVEAGRDRIKVGKGPRWRTYCYKSIDGNAGEWRVELTGANGVRAASAEFRVGGR